jgi:D-arabinose 1-dehydrogenase-like Zn-dependent alcohol dehydrogenase
MCSGLAKHIWYNPVIQLARLSGFSPIITTASLKHEGLLKSLGATEVLDRSLGAGAIQSSIAKLTSAPISTVYDTVSSPDTQEMALALLAPGGQMAITTVKSVEAKNEKKVIAVLGIKLPHTIGLLQGMYERLEGWLQQGTLKVCSLFGMEDLNHLTRNILPNNVEVLPGGLNGIVDGLQRLKDNKVSASKLVVLPQETA